ncbi:Acyl-CoA desaturase, putative [Perkinsus marinus ATCC 50983]|uniref:Acyl-CoA desaturase, putative n=1 Tax=Perkinsus marinus (strain ATCC 50983 / TXsc) TaxID=423536 RepID=C5KSP5_PERM5|nr:Acyl-CoA desaturase, putative [Perkinsus marinus ATCC 50983]EER12488.1 Acyl-CoA desaturase, putative [Perkinsus marinus ATCC 50983]|eukprot:XP_002780693.1 Acyl-CoA desaturase, putative [Perkinsus marinus ATCC 50983]
MSYDKEVGLRMNWPMIVYISLVHIVACYSIYNTITRPHYMLTYVWTIILWFISGFGITAGAHRLWSHRSYKARYPLRVLLMIFNSIANQGSVIHWVRDHRLHHLYSDTDKDPHDSQRGFFYSHVGWLLVRKPKRVLDAGRKISLNDLYKDNILLIQHRLCPWWNMLWCFIFPAIVGYYLWDESILNGILLPGVFRYCFVLHATWCVNSVVHQWGPKPYDNKSHTTENGIVAFIALGEGWHNYHHTFDWDYVTAEMGAIKQYNPTKVFIDIMYYLGLAYNLRRAYPKGWEHLKSRNIRKLGGEYHVVEGIYGIPPFCHRTVTYVQGEGGGGGRLLSETQVDNMSTTDEEGL